MLKTVLAIFYSELLLLLRNAQEWLYPLIFFIIVIALFPICFRTDTLFLQKFIPGGIWIAACLASLLSIQPVFYSDLEDGNLEQLLLCSLDLSLIIFIKLFALWLVTELPLILLIPLIGVIFHLSISAIFILCISLLLGTPILILIGSLAVALTLRLPQQGALLGILVLPLVTPILIFGVSLIERQEAGMGIAGALAFLGGILLLSLSFLPFTIAAALRVSMDE